MRAVHSCECLFTILALPVWLKMHYFCFSMMHFQHFSRNERRAGYLLKKNGNQPASFHVYQEISIKLQCSQGSILLQ